MNAPNIVLIMSDQHNPGIAGYEGNNIIRTPNLDMLARRGVAFSNLYCPSPLCVPSRTGFMTAQYPSAVNVWSNTSILSSHVPTFANKLDESGYETVLCGRMHFDGPDKFHGFAKRIYGDCDYFLTDEIKGEGTYKTCGQTKYAVQVSGYGKAGYEAFDSKTTQKACDLIKTWTRGTKPCCMVTGYVLPHNPLICSKELFDFYYEKLSTQGNDKNSELNPAIAKWRKNRGVDELTPEENRRALAAYYGLISQMDENIGKIIEAVDNSPLAENTIIIYCSDHGDCANEHGLWWKSNYYDASARVPLIISCPALFDSNKRVDNVASLLDLPSTLLDIAGTENLPKASGQSLKKFLKADTRPKDWPNEIFSEYNGDFGEHPSCMIRSGKWKLMYYPEFNSHLLFDMENDPCEINDLAGNKKYAEVAETLIAKILERWSPEKALKAQTGELVQREIMIKEAAQTNPHHIVYDTAKKTDNFFDFSQLTNWENIKKENKAK